LKRLVTLTTVLRYRAACDFRNIAHEIFHEILHAKKFMKFYITMPAYVWLKWAALQTPAVRFKSSLMARGQEVEMFGQSMLKRSAQVQYNYNTTAILEGARESAYLRQVNL